MSVKRIQRNDEKIVALMNKNIDLTYLENIKKAKRFEHIKQNFGTKREPIMKNVKFMIYNQYFIDEDTKEKIKIERRERVEVDGKRCDQWGREITYYTVETLHY